MRTCFWVHKMLQFPPFSFCFALDRKRFSKSLRCSPWVQGFHEWYMLDELLCSLLNEPCQSPARFQGDLGNWKQKPGHFFRAYVLIMRTLTEDLQFNTGWGRFMADPVFGLTNVDSGLMTIHWLNYQTFGLQRLFSTWQQIVLEITNSFPICCNWAQTERRLYQK